MEALTARSTLTFLLTIKEIVNGATVTGPFIKSLTAQSSKKVR